MDFDPAWGTVLVVSDDLGERLAIVETFAQRGFDSVGSSVGLAAQLARGLRPGLVVLDGALERSAELARELRTLDGFERVFVVAMTGDDQSAGRDLAIDEYVRKPADFAALVAVVERWAVDRN